MVFVGCTDFKTNNKNKFNRQKLQDFIIYNVQGLVGKSMALMRNSISLVSFILSLTFVILCNYTQFKVDLANRKFLTAFESMFLSCKGKSVLIKYYFFPGTYMKETEEILFCHMTLLNCGHTNVTFI